MSALGFKELRNECCPVFYPLAVKSHSARVKNRIKPKPIQMNFRTLVVLVFNFFSSLPPILPFSPLLFEIAGS